MINLKDGQISQILPEYISGWAGVQALSFALYRAVEKLMGYCGNIGVFAVIDMAPDYVLDMLALDLNTQHYDNSLQIQSKRELIKNTMVWYRGAGTPEAVEKLINAVFGDGRVEEWFQYGGKPYMFRILTNADSRPEAIEEFEKLIRKVKNMRSHIESVIFCRKQETTVYVAIVNIARISVRTGWEE